MAVYATPEEVRPLVGNISEGIDDAQIQLAIDSATDEVNSKTNRQPPNDWQTTDPNYDYVKKITRYLAAIEISIPISDFAESREAMRREIARMFETITTFDVDTSTDYSETSDSMTWPMNSENGIIWSSRFPNLRKHSVLFYEESDLYK